MAAPIAALGVAISADPAAAYLIQTQQADVLSFQLASGAPSGALSCAGGTVTGLTGTGQGLFEDGQGLFYPGPYDLSGENCLNADGVSGTLQLDITGSDTFGGSFSCTLTGSALEAGGFAATLNGTCLIDDQPLNPSSPVAVGVLPSAAGVGSLTLTYSELQPASQPSL